MVYSNMYDDFWIREDLLQQVGWTVDNIKTHEDLLDAAEAVHVAMPELAICKDVKHFTLSFDAIYSDNTAIINIQYPSVITAVNILDEESDEVINWLKSDWCKELIKMTEMWYERDLITPEHVTDQAYFESQAQNNNCLLGFGNPSYVYSHGDKEKNPEIHNAYLKLGDTPNFVAKDYDWCWGISAAAEENADKYIGLIDWTYASEENYMFSLYGVEGVDWKYKEDGRSIEKLVNDSMFYDWMYSTYYYRPIVLKDYQSQEELDQYLAFDETAIQAKTMGFMFDQTAVETEYTLINAVLTEQAKPIYYGLGDYDKDWPAVIEALDSAGLDKYVAEYQAQFTAHMANR
jgi:putative aldouronate transport system substrate-binding protein